MVTKALKIIVPISRARLTDSTRMIFHGLVLLCGVLFAPTISLAANAAGNGVEAGQIIREVALPDGLSSAQSIAIDAEGRVWFTEKVGKKLTSFDPETNTFKTHALPLSWGKVGFSKFALSPDGDVWFTLSQWVGSGKEPHILGRFSPADGYFTKYDLSIHILPKEIIVDASGIIWFTTYDKNSLYRVDPESFALKGYAIPAANSYPGGLASDSKGNIWFSEPNANKLGKFIPGKNVFYEYPVPTPFANPGDISIDKHDNVWFVQTSANRIGLFYPQSQRFDEAIIPTPNSSPNALVNDENGNVWFLEYRGNKVGFFDPTSARFREFTIPNFSSLPGDMVIDHKRSIIWFTQGSTESKRLGMLSIDKALADSGK